MNEIVIHTCTEEDQPRWDEFVNTHLECTSYHRWQWKPIFEAVFGWPGIYLLAEVNGTIRGILPLIRQKCMLHCYLSSMPHLKGGGIVAENSDVENALYTKAIEVARMIDATYLELRHLVPHNLPLERRQDKVGAILPIEPNEEARLQRLDKKTRNLVRKSLTYGMTAEFGRANMLHDFYHVYRQNMHDLGSPAYSQLFFAEILNRLPETSHICIIRSNGKEVAGAFLLGFRDTLEVGWASSYRKALNLKPNMFLYWNILNFAAASGYRYLDFGRSTRDSGTYEFKLQWGALPADLHWGYWHNHATRQPEKKSEGMQLASVIWRRLPVTFTNIVGPRLIRHIPGI